MGFRTSINHIITTECPSCGSYEYIEGTECKYCGCIHFKSDKSNLIDTSSKHDTTITGTSG